jgi:hypothetical protein
LLRGKYIRWGRVEKDIHAVLERHLTPAPADLAEAWLCKCNYSNTGPICTHCGELRPSR